MEIVTDRWGHWSLQILTQRNVSVFPLTASSFPKINPGSVSTESSHLALQMFSAELLESGTIPPSRWGLQRSSAPSHASWGAVGMKVCEMWKHLRVPHTAVLKHWFVFPFDWIKPSKQLQLSYNRSTPAPLPFSSILLTSRPRNCPGTRSLKIPESMKLSDYSLWSMTIWVQLLASPK